MTTPDTLMDLIQIMLSNIMQATIQQYMTALIRPGCATRDPECVETFTDYDGHFRDLKDPPTWKFTFINSSEIKCEWTNDPNILGLITFAIVLGMSITKLGEKSKALLDFFMSLSEAMMTITTWVISLAPVAVFFLIERQMLGIQDFGLVLEQLRWYFSTVIIGNICNK